MPNYISINDDIFKLPDDPVKSASAATNIKALGNGNFTFSAITTQITNQDSSVVQLKSKTLYKVFKESGK